MKNQLSFFQGQLQQLLIGAGLIITIILSLGIPEVSASRLLQGGSTILGFGIGFWYIAALLIPYLHQVAIAPLWRGELLEQKMTGIFGSTDRAFKVFRFVFALFFVPRMLIVIPVSLLTKNSMIFTLQSLLLIITIPLTIIALYGGYSVARFFGVTRAFGADHFFEEYRNLPRVNQGLFRFTSNAMYTYVIALIWIPAVFLGSVHGLVVGLFSHFFVWVHYYFIEKPDMEYIYS